MRGKYPILQKIIINNILLIGLKQGFELFYPCVGATVTEEKKRIYILTKPYDKCISIKIYKAVDFLLIIVNYLSFYLANVENAIFPKIRVTKATFSLFSAKNSYSNFV